MKNITKFEIFGIILFLIGTISLIIAYMTNPFIQSLPIWVSALWISISGAMMISCPIIVVFVMISKV